MHRKFFERDVELDLVVEQHQPTRDPRLLGVLDQSFTPLRLLDLAGALEQGFEIAIFDDQLGRGLDADARHARHVVGGITRQRLNLDHLLWRHAEFLDHLGHADAAVLHGVEHRHLVGDELHQILVRGHDGRGGAALAGLSRVGGDQVVGFKAGLFEAGQVECANRLADQRELRNQIVRRRRPVRLVVGIELVAERDFGFIEDDREMGRPVVRRHVTQQLPQHVAKAEYRIDLQTVGFAVQRRKRVVGAENIRGTVDQKHMVALLEGFGGRRWGRLLG